MNKKKIIIIVAIVVFILMLTPIPMRLKDGGSVEYKAILYKYTKIHRLSEQSSTGYEDGWELKILGIYVGGEVNTYVLAEHKISIRSNDKIVEANTGSFCYKEGTCLDKTNFQDFHYNVIASYYDNKLYLNNLDGSIKSIQLFDYSSKKIIDVEIKYTDEYIITPSISGLFIFKINAIYQGKSIEYYFMSEISKNSGEDINVNMEIKKDTLTDTGLTMIVENLSDKDLEYGNPYTLEKYEDGFWKDVQPINDMFFTMPAFGLNRNESVELKINWEYGYGKLKGKYRIVKRFSYKENDDHIFFNKYLEFEI